VHPNYSHACIRTIAMLAEEFAAYAEGRLFRLLKNELIRDTFLVGGLGDLDCFVDQACLCPFAIYFVRSRGTGIAAAETIQRILRALDSQRCPRLIAVRCPKLRSRLICALGKSGENTFPCFITAMKKTSAPSGRKPNRLYWRREARNFMRCLFYMATAHLRLSTWLRLCCRAKPLCWERTV